MQQEALKAGWLKEDEEQIDAAVGALLQHGGGRKLLWWLLEIGKVGQQPFHPDALTTAFACGELNVGQRVLDRITTVSPEGYLTMLKEQNDARRTRDDQLGTDNRDSGDPEPSYGGDDN